MACMLELWIGQKDTGVRVREDGVYRAMWRICWPGGALSPMCNISRAKEAAILFARPRGLGGHAVARWHVREIDVEAPPAARSAVAVVGGPGGPTAPWRALGPFLALPDPNGTLRK